ncbi:MAG TPA: hypothetical protein VMD91_11260 [Candidatus Sulfotelmatobacter sp.]|nr:hypothetical protein [Candidatus Sulfotelmatobacter sp.]
MRARVAGVLALVVAVAPLAVRANDADDALRLAQRLAERGMRTAHVRLHALPPGLPAGLPLPAAPLLASVVTEPPANETSPFGGFTFGARGDDTTLFYDAPDRAAVVAAFEGALTSAGWSRSPGFAAFAQLLPRGGFPLQLPDSGNRIWCSPGAHATTVTVTQPAGDPRALDIGIGTALAGPISLCTPPAGNASPFASPLPSFTAPAGVTFIASGPATDGSTSGASIVSSLGLDGVFAGLAAQLQGAGWAPGDQAHSATLRAQRFTKTVDGQAYVTLLTLEALDATHFVALVDATPTGR